MEMVSPVHSPMSTTVSKIMAGSAANPAAAPVSSVDPPTSSTCIAAMTLVGARRAKKGTAAAQRGPLSRLDTMAGAYTQQLRIHSGTMQADMGASRFPTER